MQWSLFVLILMGQCSFFTCHLYEYHFIPEGKTWEEAQSYCREKYTDLATVFDMRGVERLINSPQTTDAWIGLRSNNESGINKWQWSVPGEKYKQSETDWGTGQTDNGANHCAVIQGRQWHGQTCNKKFGFICYNEPSQTYHCITVTKSWIQAQSYCREHHTDLVSGFTLVNDINYKCGSSNLWIGLFREMWSWSDGKNFSFRQFAPDSLEDEASKTCAMTTPNGKWSSDICTNRKPFYCYEDKVILINESKTWDEALTYCRTNHRVLVSITDSHQQKWVEERVKMADTEFVWLGMRYTCSLDLSFRVSDHSVCNPNLVPPKKTVRCESELAVAMKRDGEWYKKADSEKFHFICAK